jgi:signal transduction histidine kinase/ligand-binding sensor domain-containing protein
MKLLISRCLLMFLLFQALNGNAQQQQLKFIQVTGTNGISLGKINAIIRDKYGFLWLSDQSNRCIIRYDGSHMTRYQNDPKNPNSLGGFYPESLFADSNGNIWIGFYGMGLDKFDPVTNHFTHYRHKEHEPGTLSNDFVTALLRDHLGNLWVGTYGGLDLMDEKTNTFKNFRNNSNDPSSLSCDTVRVLYEDKSGVFWVGTGFAFQPGDGGGLNKYNRNTSNFTRYLHDPKNPCSLIDNKVRAIFEDSYGNFWVGTAGDGLHTMDRKTGSFTRHSYNPAKPDQLSRTAIEDQFDHITFITEDAERKIWIGTLWNGLIRYDPLTKKIDHFGSRDDRSGIFKDSSSWCATPTPDGLVWLSTQRANLFSIDLYNTIIPYHEDKTHRAYWCFNEEGDSVFWYGTNNGVLRKNRKDGTEHWFLHDPYNLSSLSNDTVSRIIKDKQGDFWICTKNGLNHFQAKTGKFSRYDPDPTNPSRNGIYTICQGKDSLIWGAVWTSDELGGGLARLNLKTGKFTFYKNDPADQYTISNNKISSIVEDDNTDLWIGTMNTGGLNRMNVRTGKSTNYMPGLVVSDLYKDSSGVIWAGTLAGLFWYDKKTDRFISIANNNTGTNIVMISSVTGDRSGNIWISTETGIYMLNKKRDRVIRFGRENGVPEANAQFFDGSAFTSQQGYISFGDVWGYYTFDPDKMNRDLGTAPLYITRFWLDNTEIFPGKNSPLKTTWYNTREISLKHDQNVFSLSATFIDFRNRGDRQLYYMLENYDNDWRTSAVEERIQYYKVPPGQYIFRIKSPGAGNGAWVEKSLTIIISAPWWSTWWAYIIYGLLFILAVFLVHRYQKEQILQAEREKTRVKELIQAREIEKAYHELRTTQSQLIQNEKMASLGELTAGIAHEIQNPLNFVNNFSDINKELIEELELEQKKEIPDLKHEQDLMNDIKTNEDKISFHGRRADAIVKSMLQHSRTGSGKKEPTDINALADEYLRLSYHGLRAKEKLFNCTMETHYDTSLGLVNCIPQDIGRVLLNLYNNAFYSVHEKKKQLPEGYEPTVSVSTKKLDGRVEIKVKDNGNGIPQKILDKIFQPFFTTKPTGQGTGLGLSMSYDIIRAHGGELKVGTMEGGGAEFVFQIPTI